MSLRGRAWVFTKNNCSDDSFLDELALKYAVCGKEKAPTTGTPHLQGYVYFHNARTASQVRQMLPGCHIEKAKGNARSNLTYCSKGGDYREIGDRPLDPTEKGRKEIDRYATAWARAREGNLEEIDADIRVRCYTTLRRIERDYMPPVQSLEGTCGIWVYGESGSGKTRGVLAKYPECFPKPRTVWWDGYQSEEVVLIDDIDKYDVRLGGNLKHWADFCPFIAQTKGSSIKIRPKKIIVTSQYRIEDIWEDPETRDALRRRFRVVEKKEGEELVLE